MDRVIKRKAGRPAVTQPAKEWLVQRQRETSRNFRQRKADHLKKLEEAAKSCSCGAFAKLPDCNSSENDDVAASRDRIASLETENVVLRQMLLATTQNTINYSYNSVAFIPNSAPTLLQISNFSFPDANSNPAPPLNNLNISSSWLPLSLPSMSEDSPIQSQDLTLSKLAQEKPFLEFVAEISVGFVRQKLLNIPLFGMQSELVDLLCECFKDFTVIMNETGPGPDDCDNILDRPEFLPVRRKLETCFVPKALLHTACLAAGVHATVHFTMKRATREHRSYVLKVLNNENP
ncbi:hypothetical protein HK100_006608, partial [Physocladia obscura]